MTARMEQALAAERSVLAASMMDGASARAVADSLAPDDFAFPEHRAVFEAVRTLAAQGAVVDFISLHDRVQGNPDVKAAGGMPWLLGLHEYYLSSTLTDSHIRAVRESGRAARVAREAARILADGGDAVEGFGELVERERARSAEGPRGALRTMEQIEAFAAALAEPDPMRRIPTGMGQLDRLLGGLERGCVSCLGARPGSGKTALALNWLAAAVRSGHRAAFFSLEMSASKILARLASIVSGADNAIVNSGKLTNRQIADLAGDLVTLASGERMLLYDDARTLRAIREAIARERPAIAFVDFLQFVIEDGRAENENYRLAGIVREFKRLARSCDCHICYLSQVGRSGDKAPELRDLYGSGAIEQGSDTILLLDRPNARDRAQPPDLAWLLVGKNKDGACGRLKLCFDGPRQRFRDA